MARTGMDYQGTYGRRPDKIWLDRVDAEQQQQAAITGNIDATTKAGELSRKAGEMDTDALIALMERALPNYADTQGKALEMARSMMGGEAPQAMRDQVAKRAREKDIAAGTTGSQFANFGELQSFGLNTLDVMQKGFDMFGQVADRTRALVGNPMSVTSMFMTPEQRLGHATGERDRNVEVSSYNRNLQAMPDAGLVAQQDAARMAAVSGVGQPVGPQLVGPLNPSRNVSLSGAAQGLNNPFSGGLAGYQSRAKQRLKGNYSSANYTTA